MDIKLKGLDEFSERLSKVDQKQIPFALARALTALGKIGRDRVQEDINQNVENGTAFTKRAAFFEGRPNQSFVKKGDNSVTFGVRPIQSEYLDAQYFGGSSTLRPFESRFEGKHLVPAYGADQGELKRAPQAYIKQVLGDARAKKNGYYMTKKTVRYRPKGGESAALFTMLDSAPTLSLIHI